MGNKSSAEAAISAAPSLNGSRATGAYQASRARGALRATILFATCLLGSGLITSSASAAIIVKNDPGLPASLDGNNITEDTVTGLQWLDVTITADRTFDDIVGNDGTNEFAPGGDFEGFRHATADELTGWNAGPQLDSLFINYAMNSTFSSIGTYDRVRDFLADLGCHGSCGSWGRIYGIYTKNGDPSDPEWAEIEAFSASGFNWGSLGTGGSDVFLPRSENAGDAHVGHFLIREAPMVVPMMDGFATVVLALLILGVSFPSARLHFAERRAPS